MNVRIDLLLAVCLGLASKGVTRVVGFFDLQGREGREPALVGRVIFGAVFVRCVI